MVSRQALFTVLCLSLGHVAFCVMSSSTCELVSNTNITAVDLSPAQFVVSVEDCCRKCSETSGCAAAVFAGYYCHLKSAAEPQANCTVTPCTAIIINEATTTAPQPTTAKPTTAAPKATTTTTAIPTAAPPSAPPVTIVRETVCLYSSHCNILDDGSCLTKVYFNDTCFKKHRRTCGDFHITVEAFATDDGCAGKAVSTTKEELDACVPYDSYNFAGHYCDTWPYPVLPYVINRVACRYGCGSPGDQCGRYNLTSGACTSGPSAFRGNSIFALVFPAYIVYEEYQTFDCSGAVTDRWAEPRENCWTGENYVYYLNNVTLP